MRYSKGYNEWANLAERRGSLSDKERAALTAAKIRDNHSGSDQDKCELARMESIAGNSADDDLFLANSEERQSTRNKSGSKSHVSKPSPAKLSKRDFEQLSQRCFNLGKEAAEADWDANDLLDDPAPHSGDPTMQSYAQVYSSDYHALLRTWREGYHEQAAQFRLKGMN